MRRAAHDVPAASLVRAMQPQAASVSEKAAFISSFHVVVSPIKIKIMEPSSAFFGHTKVPVPTRVDRVLTTRRSLFD